MSMFIVSNECLNDVANLIVKLYPYMDLKDVFNRLLKLNIEIWNNKYNRNTTIDDLNYTIKDYSKYAFKTKDSMTKFSDEYYWVQITQLVHSLDCYHYQIEEYYIENIDNRFTYDMMINVYDNTLIKEIRNYIQYNDLNCLYDNDKKYVNTVEWNR